MSKDRVTKSKSVNRQAAFNILGPIVLNGINFFTIPIFTRMLGPTNYGIVFIYLAWMQVFTIIVGLQTSGTIATSIVRIKKDEQDKYRSSILTLSFCSLIIVSLIVLAFINPLSNFFGLPAIIIFLMIAQSFGCFIVDFSTAVFSNEKEGQKTFALTVITSITTIILSMLLIFKYYDAQENYLGRIIGMAVPYIIIGCAMLIYFVAKGKTLFNKEYWSFCLPFCLPLIFHMLSLTILSQSDRVMLQHLSTDSQVGIYSLYYVFANILNVIWLALNNTWLPFYFENLKDNDMELIEKRSRNYLFLYTGLVVGFICVAPEVIKLMASADFYGGMKLIPILALSMFMIYLYGFPVNFQFYHKNTRLIAVGTICAGALNVFLNWVLIPRFDIYGAALATLISYIMLYVFHDIIARFVIKNYHYKPTNFLPYFLVVLATSALFYVIIDFWIIRWILAVATAILLIVNIIKNRSIF